MSERSWRTQLSNRTRKAIRRTYSARLAFAGQQLQTFIVTEFDQDVDCPLVVVFMFTNSNFARTTQSYDGMCRTDASDEQGGHSLSKAAENFLPMLETRASSAGCQLS